MGCNWLCWVVGWLLARLLPLLLAAQPAGVQECIHPWYKLVHYGCNTDLCPPSPCKGVHLLRLQRRRAPGLTSCPRKVCQRNLSLVPPLSQVCTSGSSYDDHKPGFASFSATWLVFHLSQQVCTSCASNDTVNLGVDKATGGCSPCKDENCSTCSETTICAYCKVGSGAVHLLCCARHG